MYYYYLLKILSPIGISIRLLATCWHNQIFKTIKRIIQLGWYLRITYYGIYITCSVSQYVATAECLVSNLSYALAKSHIN